MSVGPSSWPRVKLGDVLRHVARPLTVEFDVLYREIGIRSHGKGLFHKAPVTGAAIGDKRVFYVEPGDFVLNIVFAWEGATGVVSEAERGMIASHRFPCFRAVEGLLDLHYLERFFHTPAGLQLLGRVSPGGAGRNRTLNRTSFMQQEIPLPPLPEQHRIVARIENLARKLDDVADIRANVASELDSLATALAFRADLSEREREQNGWRRCRLGEVMRASDDFVPVRSDESYANFGIYSFGRGLFRKPDISGLLSSAPSLNRVRTGQFIYSRLFAFEGAYGIVTDEFGGSFVSNEYPTFDCDRDALLPEVLAAYLRPKAMWAKVAEGSKGLGDRRQRVQPQQLLAHELWLPPMKDQRTLATVWGELQVARKVQRVASNELDALLPAILDRAFAGAL